MKPQELRTLSVEELRSKQIELKKKLFEMNYERKYGKVDKPHLFQDYRKDIARINTILREKKNEN